MLFAIVGVVLEHLGVTDVTGLFLKTSKSPSPGKSFQKAKRPEKSRIDLQNQEFIFHDFKESQVCKQIMNLPEDKFDDVIKSFGTKLKWNEDEVMEVQLMKYSTPFVTSLYKFEPFPINEVIIDFGF